MAVKGSERPRHSRRVAGLVLAGVGIVLSGCSAGQWQRAGLPEPATEQTPLIGDLWIGTWIAALAVGVLVWGLILWAAFRYRKRDDDLPPQTRFNAPIEFLYTMAPFAIIAALFYWTVVNQTEILDNSEDPDISIGVVGQQWSWTFNYLDADVYTTGTPNDRPTLYLPVDQTVEFQLDSPDVVHSFWVPAFYMKLDVIPGKSNSFQVTPNEEGSYSGKCAELCGVYHSRMLFDVEIVSQSEFDQHMADLEERGQTGNIDAPLRATYTQEPGETDRVQDGEPSS